MPKRDTIPIVEIFGPTIQGEGYLAGRRTMFIRTAYCDGAGRGGWCSWCDTMYAVNPMFKAGWTWMTPAEILQRLQHLGTFCQNVTITGGNPALHDLSVLMDLLKRERYTINVETQGTVFHDWLCRADVVTLSPKPPSSGSTADMGKFTRVIDGLRLPDRVSSIPMVVVKIAVDPDNEQDYRFASRVLSRYNPAWPKRYMTVVTKPSDRQEDILDRYRRLVHRVCQDPTSWDVSVLPQLHVLIWGHKGGV